VSDETKAGNALGVAEFVSALRDELETLDNKRRDRGKDALLVLESVTVEVSFVVTDSDRVDGGFDLKIVKLGAEKSVSAEQVHKLSLEMKVSERARAGAIPGARYHASAKGQVNTEDVVPLE
jgi:hypothetical protein